MFSCTMNASSTLALAREIDLHPSVRERIAEALTPSFLDEHAAACIRLTESGSASDAWKALETALAGTDPNGMRLLALYLSAACVTREKYREAGVSDHVFIDTMGCFSRFLRDEIARNGAYGFSRGFWAWRQLSLRLFRLGTLEFEYYLAKENEPLPPGIAPGMPMLSVHIPSDARLKDGDLRDSYRQAGEFFAGIGARFCPQGAPQAMFCHTWLLSRALRGLLPAQSGILRFGSDYEIYADDLADESFYTWLFACKKPPEPLPVETSLQRAVCAHLEKGGIIGAAYGAFII